jgi:hypothetical protein
MCDITGHFINEQTTNVSNINEPTEYINEIKQPINLKNPTKEELRLLRLAYYDKKTII